MTPMNVEDRPALRVNAKGDEGPGAQGYMVVLEWKDISTHLVVAERSTVRIPANVTADSG